MEWEKLLSTERFAGRGRDREESCRSDYDTIISALCSAGSRTRRRCSPWRRMTM